MELSFNEDFYGDKNASLRASLDSSLTPDQDFLEFYNSSEKNKELVERMHYLLNPDNFLMYVNSVDMPEQLRYDIFKTYLDHFYKLESMIKMEDEKKY